MHIFLYSESHNGNPNFADVFFECFEALLSVTELLDLSFEFSLPALDLGNLRVVFNLEAADARPHDWGLTALDFVHLSLLKPHDSVALLLLK